MIDKSIFVFRRDLRLEDNTALNEALKVSKLVIPVFIIDPRQFDPHPYLSTFAKKFLIESLIDLDIQLKQHGSKLHILYGIAEEIIPKICKEGSCSAVFINRDYTPFSNLRDESILESLKPFSISLFAYHDTLLVNPLDSVKPDGKPYTVFTPFFKKNSNNNVRECSELIPGNLFKFNFKDLKDENFLIYKLEELTSKFNLSRSLCKGGRTEGKKILSEKISDLINYNTNRDIPSVEGTSNLSAHHKFGTISIRETYWMASRYLSTDNKFISELYWRDFFTCVGYFFPHVFTGAFNKKFNQLQWDTDNEKFQRWCSGNTGFPIVDAGIRQLNTTGFMHNRVRMITSSFLIKDLHIDWKLGERYFATKLVDYDPAVNNGSWQWAASTGCDAQPYFRIFNPWLQQVKFDSDAVYIKHWIEELNGYCAKEIHEMKNRKALGNYPVPIIDHSKEKSETERRYKFIANPKEM